MESYFARFFESRARTDFEINQKKRTLLIFTIIALLLSLTLGTIHLLIEAYKYSLLLYTLAILCIPLFIMIRRGKYYISAVYFTLICYATLSADLMIAGTVLDTGITAFPLIIITSTFLLGPRAAIMNVLLSSLSLALVFAEMAMRPQETHHAMQFYYLDYSTIFFFILCSAFIVWKIIKNDEENLLIVTASGEKILKSLKEKEGLLKEIHHRVKNNLAVISSLLRLQSNQVEDDKYQNMLKESENRIRSMALVHEQLYQGKDFNRVDVKAYVDSLARNVRRSCSTGKEVSMNIQADEIFMAIDNLVPLGLIMNEVLTNAFQHAFHGIEKPEISVMMQKAESGNVTLTISDNGMGFPDGFDMNHCKGLGLQLVRLLTSQIKGELKVTSEDGTMFEIIFPEKLVFARHLTRDS